MGTTKVKIIDLSAAEPEVKASQKHAQSLGSANKIKKEKVSANSAKSEKTNKQNVIPDSSSVIASEAKQSDQEEIASSHVHETERGPRNEKAKKPKAPKAQKHHLGKKYLEAKAKIAKDKLYAPAEALSLLSETSYTKFDPAVEIHLNVNAKSLRGTVNFPHPTGPKKENKYLVFSEKRLAADGKQIIWAAENTIANIESGKLKPNRDFSAVIAGPKFMPLLAKVAKILGPAGMMPNPKSGTITENPLSIIESSATSGTPYQTDPTAPIIHTKLGKLSEKPEFIKENLKALVAAVGPAKIKKATITSTMSPGIRLDITSL